MGNWEFQRRALVLLLNSLVIDSSIVYQQLSQSRKFSCHNNLCQGSRRLRRRLGHFY